LEHDTTNIRAAACIVVTAALMGTTSAHQGSGSYNAAELFTISAPAR
jgi:hypothetical protein